jgi:hypothetical protein
MFRTDEEPRLGRAEASAFLKDRGYNVATATLAKYASVGGGPEYESFGSRAIYRPSKLLSWAAEKTSRPRRTTSDPKLFDTKGGAAQHEPSSSASPGARRHTRSHAEDQQ